MYLNIEERNSSIIQIVHFTERKQDRRKSNFLLVIREASLICLSEKTCSLVRVDESCKSRMYKLCFYWYNVANDAELRRCIPKLIKNPLKRSFIPAAGCRHGFAFTQLLCQLCRKSRLGDYLSNISGRKSSMKLKIGKLARSSIQIR
ncbi:hypothetical protein T05_3796 [Trichinella murrelli]|uniref:Uncharacterized protein n=1 Tax=Trichinella murrelli TaxID=144512 RepID=A0A0V0U0I2_9BILA|nr:hypothetical protein T05_3796 [Trichinella murrelli]